MKSKKHVTDPNDDTPLMQQWYAYDGMGHVIRQAVLADAGSSAGYSADPNVDKVTDFVYDDATGDYPGMLVAQTIYYAGSPATAATTTYDYDLLGRRYKTTDPVGNETLLTFDLAGRVQRRQQTDINPIQGQNNLVTASEYEYDDFGRLENLIVDPNNWTETQTTEYAYGLSLRVQETKPNGVINTTEYNTFGEKIAQIADADTGGIKQTTEWGYDRVGRQVTITGYCDETDAEDDQTTTYAYDKLGNVTQIAYPDAATIHYAYNSVGKVWKRTDQRDLVTYYVYDTAGSLSLKTDNPVSGGDTEPNLFDPNAAYFVESFTYDGLSRPLTAEKTIDGNDISASVFAYNDIGMLTSEAQTLFGGTTRTVSYTYDQFGYRTSTTYPDGSTTITRTNNWNGQIDTLSRSQTELVDYEYLGSRTVRRSYNTTTPIDADYAYDNLGRLTSINAGASLVKFDYTYWDNESNIKRKIFDHRSGDPYNEYSYDDIDRVAGVTYHNSETEAFTMDDLGNRTSVTLRDTSTDTYSVDTTTNRYNSIDSASLDYDTAGNLTVDKDGYQFTYDYENRITRIENDQQTLVAEFDYDTQGRRVRVYDTIATTTTLYYYSDAWQVLAEYDNSNNLQAYYVFGNYIDETLLMHRSSADKFYLHDHLYSTVALTDSSGVVAERYEYDAYGKATVWNAGLTTTYSASQVGNHILFTGREINRFDNNLTLQYNRMRYLSQYMGCWMTPDPARYLDSLNLYQYVKSSLTYNVDPFGLGFYSLGNPKHPKDFKWDDAYKYDSTFKATIGDRLRWIAFGAAVRAYQLAGHVPDGVRAYLHYRSATGTDLQVSYEKAYNEDELVENGVLAEISDAQYDAERIRTSSHLNHFKMTGSSEQIDTETENWQKAIGGHRIWGGADVEYDCTTKTYTMSLEITMEDFYNFNKGQGDIASGIPDDYNGRFEVLGWAKSFYSRGSLTREVDWTENDISNTTKIDGVPRRIRGRRGRR